MPVFSHGVLIYEKYVEIGVEIGESLFISNGRQRTTNISMSTIQLSSISKLWPFNTQSFIIQLYRLTLQK